MKTIKTILAGAMVAVGALNCSAYFGEGMNYEEDGWWYVRYSAWGYDEEFGDRVEIELIPDEYLDQARENKMLVLPDMVTFIDDTFEITSIMGQLSGRRGGLEGIEVIVLPKYLKEMRGCFQDLPDAREFVSGDKLTRLSFCFENVSGLTDLDVPETVKRVTGSFNHLDIEEVTLTNLVEVGHPFEDLDCVRYRSNASFSFLPNITRVEMAADMRSVSQYAFCDLENLETAVLPSNAECMLFPGMFLNCPKLRSIYAPSAIPLNTNINYIHETDEPTLNEYEFGTNWEENESRQGIDKEKCVLYVPMGAAEAYRNHPAWKGFKHIVEFDFGGVENVSADESGNSDKALYDLAGRRVYNPTPGLYIRSGEKVIIR